MHPISHRCLNPAQPIPSHLISSHLILPAPRLMNRSHDRYHPTCMHRYPGAHIYIYARIWPWPSHPIWPNPIPPMCLIPSPLISYNPASFPPLRPIPPRPIWCGKSPSAVLGILRAVSKPPTGTCQSVTCCAQHELPAWKHVVLHTMCYMQWGCCAAR